MPTFSLSALANGKTQERVHGGWNAVANGPCLALNDDSLWWCMVGEVQLWIVLVFALNCDSLCATRKCNVPCDGGWLSDSGSWSKTRAALHWGHGSSDWVAARYCFVMPDLGEGSAYWVNRHGYYKRGKYDLVLWFVVLLCMHFVLSSNDQQRFEVNFLSFCDSNVWSRYRNNCSLQWDRVLLMLYMP